MQYRICSHLSVRRTIHFPDGCCSFWVRRRRVRWPALLSRSMPTLYPTYWQYNKLKLHTLLHSSSYFLPTVVLFPGYSCSVESRWILGTITHGITLWYFFTSILNALNSWYYKGNPSCLSSRQVWAHIAGAPGWTDESLFSTLENIELAFC